VHSVCCALRALCAAVVLVAATVAVVVVAAVCGSSVVVSERNSTDAREGADGEGVSIDLFMTCTGGNAMV